MPSNPNIHQNIAFAYEVMTRKLEAQDRSHDALEAKMGVLLGFFGALAGSGAVVLFNSNLIGFNLFTLSLVGIYAAFALLIIASLPTTYYSPPGHEDVYSKEALALSVDVTKNQAVANMIAGYRRNEGIQHHKAKLYAMALRIFFVSIFLTFLSLIIIHDNAGRPNSSISAHGSSRAHWVR